MLLTVGIAQGVPPWVLVPQGVPPWVLVPQGVGYAQGIPQGVGYAQGIPQVVLRWVSLTRAGPKVGISHLGWS